MQIFSFTEAVKATEEEDDSIDANSVFRAAPGFARVC